MIPFGFFNAQQQTLPSQSEIDQVNAEMLKTVMYLYVTKNPHLINNLPFRFPYYFINDNNKLDFVVTVIDDALINGQPIKLNI